ncbi:alpha-L-rhamnosidase C-terminal domain-containing protein [Conexibacter stalactiti]|uniref:Alpha-L-rhamnosidase C-terminal domain-containing protein n=1 Tax=Conexibacter stalactiti TaxID=1940611 RepID=A0ABU4HNC1_9ACTN|nr:alpha-L-rhamnosidase C-terminal domain-containing protein [Conexibacter stalactiti]MDW5594818.1 alpha-L-rhamnosidase C-terminal domain-containing protein [Conexibacter stalactiti]MEC5035460.1 alpha-L-rhamnosidase C-terminal domain-containing protein [Conexibacter stalactiti]
MNRPAKGLLAAALVVMVGSGTADAARPAPATDPSGPWRSDDHRPRRGAWRDYVLAPSGRSLAAESILQATPRGGAIDGDANAALRADGRAVRLTSIGDRTTSPLLALDFGQEIGGHVRVKLSGASPTPPRLHACFSESKRYRALGTRNDGQARFAPGCDTANIWVGFPGTAYTYDADSHTLDIPATLPGEAYDRTLRGGFRYLTLFLDGPGSLDVDAVTVDYTPEPSRRDPSKLAGWFNSSDEELNKIWHAGVYTVQVNTDKASTAKSWPYRDGERDHADGQLPHLGPDDEVIYDGGKRDRLVWQGDLAVQNPVAYLSTWNLAAVDNSLVHLAKQQLDDGFVPASSQMGPHNAGEQRNYGEYVTWFLFNMAEHYRYTGDRAFVRQWWPALRRAAAWLESVRQQDPRGLIGFADVRSCGHYGYSDCGHETYVNALYKRNLDQLATLAGALGDTAAARTYAARADEVARAIEAQLWDEQAGAYRLSRELPAVHPQDGNAAAVLTGVASGARASRALAFLRANTWSRYGSLTVSPDEPNASLPAFYAPLPSGFEAEARFGLADDPRGLQAEDGIALLKRFWGHQLRQDPGSTFVEHLLPSGYPSLSQFSSLAHGWASGPTVVLSRRVLGVDPTAAGYERFDVAPQPAGLSWAEGAVPTPHGQVATSWTRRGDDLRIELTVPRGTTGRASVPTFGRTVQVRRDGRLVWDGRRALAAGVSRAGDRILVDGLTRGRHVVRGEAIGAGARDELRLAVTPARATVEPGDLVAVKVGLSGVARADLAGDLTVSSSDPDWEVSPKTTRFALDSDGRPVSDTLKAYVVVPDDATSGRRTITVTARTRGGASASGTTTLSLTARRTLFGFEQDTEGWQAGANVSGLARVTSFANGPGKPSEGAGALEATARSVAASALKSVSVTPARVLDLSAASELHVMLDAYGGAPGASGYEAVLTVTGAGGETRTVTTAVSADAWNRVSLDLAGWAGRTAVSRVEVGFRATGSDTLWQPRFQLDDVGITSG